MPIKNATGKLKTTLEQMTTDSWLDADAINTMFKTKAQKQKLVELRSILAAATKKNESAAATWAKLGMVKDVVLKLAKKSAGLV